MKKFSELIQHHNSRDKDLDIINVKELCEWAIECIKEFNKLKFNKIGGLIRPLYSEDDVEILMCGILHSKLKEMFELTEADLK